MKTPLTIIIPMAGYGSRLRPHTWSRPKQLLNIAGKTVLDHVLERFNTLPTDHDVEYIFIVGYLREKLEEHMQQKHPDLKVRFIVQEERKGQSHALYLAKQHIQGDTLIVFADTLIDADLSFLPNEQADAVIWVKQVPDPRRFGVTVLSNDGNVTQLIEKPSSMENDLAVVGFYYFKNGEQLIRAIEKQMADDTQKQGEYYIADAINIMLGEGTKLRTERVGIWLDAGTPDAMLTTNQYLLDNGNDNSSQARSLYPTSTIISPVYIHPTAEVKASIIGPYTSIGQGCKVSGAIIRNSIIEDNAQTADILLEDSFIGQNAKLEGFSNSLNLGDNAYVSFQRPANQ